MSYISEIETNMNETIQKNTDFMNIYNRSYRLAAAVFMISNVIDKDEELKTKIKSLSLNLVSVSVSLKDISFSDAKKIMSDLEKNSLELMSMLDIAAVSGLVSQMNAGILREEFQSFISELGKFSERFETNKNISVQNIFTESAMGSFGDTLEKIGTGDENRINKIVKSDIKNITFNGVGNREKNGNGLKRKDLRKNIVLEFIKGHTDVSIKDIVPNINGCSEKTIQRELINLIKENKIKKTGERRWSRYSII
jgi:hypothetical protein